MTDVSGQLPFPEHLGPDSPGENPDTMQAGVHSLDLPEAVIPAEQDPEVLWALNEQARLDYQIFQQNRWEGEAAERQARIDASTPQLSLVEVPRTRAVIPEANRQMAQHRIGEIREQLVAAPPAVDVSLNIGAPRPGINVTQVEPSVESFEERFERLSWRFGAIMNGELDINRGRGAVREVQRLPGGTEILERMRSRGYKKDPDTIKNKSFLRRIQLVRAVTDEIDMATGIIGSGFVWLAETPDPKYMQDPDGPKMIDRIVDMPPSRLKDRLLWAFKRFA